MSNSIEIDAEEWREHFASCIKENNLVKCPYCGGNHIIAKNYSYVNYTVCEYDFYCEDCEDVVATFEYGAIFD